MAVHDLGSDNESEWYEDDRNFSFYDLKGYANEFLETILPGNKLQNEYFRDKNLFLDYGFIIRKNSRCVGYGGIVKSKVLNNFDISQDVYIFNVNLDLLQKCKVGRKEFQELLKS